MREDTRGGEGERTEQEPKEEPHLGLCEVLSTEATGTRIRCPQVKSLPRSHYSLSL